MGHRHPANIARHDDRTLGERVADSVAQAMGSWRFIIAQTVILAVWIGINVTAYLRHWDPYPFILLNLGLSTQAAYAAPLLQLSQNRQAEHDRIRAEHDYEANQESLAWGRAIGAHLGVELPDVADAEGSG